MNISRWAFTALFAFHSIVSWSQEYDIRDFGAVGDGKKDNTKAIQKAIDKCSETGGKVIFPGGTFATGTIFLKSNVTIYLSQKATWIGYPDLALFPDVPSNELSRMDVTGWKAFLYAFDQENIAITGPGTFYPRGEHEVFQNNIVNSKERPYGMHIVKCRNVVVKDIQMKHSAFWMARFLHCDKLRISGIRIFNHANLNNDGVDIDGCKDVIVSDCHIDSSDDALCFKSEGNRVCEDVVVTNCILSSHASALKWGTGSFAGFRNFSVSNIVIRPSKATKMIHPARSWVGLNAIDLGNVDGGILKDITINNVMIDSIETPIFIRLGARLDRSWLPNSGKPEGLIENVAFSNINATNCGNVSTSITGYPGNRVKNIRFDQVYISTTGKGTLSDTTTRVVEPTRNYPINRMFNSNLPAFGLYIRHAEGVYLNDVTLNTTAEEPRSALFTEDVKGLFVENLRSNKSHRATSLIQLRDVDQATITGDTEYEAIGDFLDVSGSSVGIRLVNNRFEEAQRVRKPKNFTAKAKVDKVSFVELQWEKDQPDGGLNQFVVYRDGEEITRTRGTSFSDYDISEKKSYNYTLQAQNGFGQLSSSLTAQVKTLEDKEAMELTSLDIVDGKTLLLRFSEAIDEKSVLNKANYRFDPTIAIEQVSFNDNESVLLTVSGLSRNQTYQLELNGLKDKSLSGNALKNVRATMIDRPLVAHWTFDEGKGATVVDQNEGNCGVVKNPIWVKGKKGTALDFDGVSSHIRFAEDSKLDLIGDMAIAMWIKVEAADFPVYSRVINKRNAWNDPHGYELEYNASRDRFSLTGAGETGDDQGNIFTDLDKQWHHLVAMTRNGQAIFYLDGEYLGTDEHVASPTKSPQ
ncbi:MAG: hypothetical protein KI790_17770, partial [Cyclobacteriaceae bacterium]|nr:hypothetical protein [Cyclobacteriaceae bacterium HetDA_MAG_MS6]